jgi:hypothetical protein
MGEWPGAQLFKQKKNIAYRYTDTYFLTSALGGGEWPASHLGRFTPEEGPNIWSGRSGEEKILDPTGTRTLTSRYFIS